MGIILGLILIFCVSVFGTVDGVQLPKDFQIEVLQNKIKDARSMALSPSGILFVGSRSEGVYAIVHADLYKGSLKPGVRNFARELSSPNGVTFYKGHLYVAEISRILKYADIEKQLAAGEFKFQVLRDDLPDKTHHGWKYLAVGPDEWLYFGIGAPCNICESEDKRFASISRISLDGKKFEIFVHGVRNTVGFDWHPKSKELWFTDNGRDWMGDDAPNDELNRVTKPGEHFGFPYCHDEKMADPDFGKKRKCEEFVKPQALVGPHVAALGMKFYRGKQFPEKYHGKIFMAQHGSWNRSKRIGYRIGFSDPEKANSFEVFAHGWLKDNGSVSGRPVDVLETADGSLLVSDDSEGAIYRITYRK